MPSGSVTAVQLLGSVDPEGFPPTNSWTPAPPAIFNHDWQGKNADPERETEVRLLWTPEALFLRFACHYRAITVFSDADPSGRRWQLWDRDVAEVFLQPDPSMPTRYFEFEVSPNGFWIDLDIRPGEKLDPKSGLTRRVTQNANQKLWTAELSIPMRSLTPSFNPASPWRVNFFRCEGPSEPRFYSAWQPTNTPHPNFHVPAAFALLRFLPDR